MALTPKQQLFADYFLVDLNATQAAIKAGYSPKTATAIGNENLTKPEIASYIEKARSEKARNIVVDRNMVLQKWSQLAFKDASDLVETKVGACRYCHGVDHQYQWTKGEWQRRCDEIEQRRMGTDEEMEELPDPAGGFGYDPRRDPVASCTECFGEGVPRVVVGNSRGNPLYAGAEQERGGKIKVKLHDQMAALNNIAKNLGMLTDRVELDAVVQHVEDDRKLALAALALFRKTVESDK